MPFTRDAAVIVVAQRVSTIVNADDIIVLEDGEVIDESAIRRIKDNRDYNPPNLSKAFLAAVRDPLWPAAMTRYNAAGTPQPALASDRLPIKRPSVVPPSSEPTKPATSRGDDKRPNA